jgi:hypothetical protein
MERDDGDGDLADHELRVEIPYDEAACDAMLEQARGLRRYFLANWHVDAGYAIHLADALHDLMFSPPGDDERSTSRSLDLGVTAHALRRAIQQPTGSPPPVLRSVPRST